MIKRYQNYRQPETEEQIMKTKQFAKTALFFNNNYPRGFNGDTWDAKHLTSFLSRSNYSNWHGNQANISRTSFLSDKRSYSTRGDHFFKTTREDRNQSKIGFTPIFPLVSNCPVAPAKQLSLREFFNSSQIKREEERVVSGRPFRLRCSPDDRFKFEGNAVKYQQTDPITMTNQQLPLEAVNGYRKQRMNRLIERRHPHGMTGIDHPENPQSNYYSVYEEKVRIREEPNSHRTFLLDREWKGKKRSVPPVDEWKTRKAITIRKFRNENAHGYNILTNRKIEE